MKYEPRKFRQKSSDWYGRKGMSWHDSVVTFRMVPGEQEEMGDNDTVKIKNLYFDHVCKNDSSQTSFQVCSILELL